MATVEPYEYCERTVIESSILEDLVTADANWQARQSAPSGALTGLIQVIPGSRSITVKAVNVFALYLHPKAELKPRSKRAIAQKERYTNAPGVRQLDDQPTD